MERLDDAALGAITLHELGHLAEGPQLLRLRALQPLLLLPVVALKPAWFHLGSLGSLGFVLLWFVGVLVARRFMVARMQAAESAADSVAGQGHDNEAYSRVLEQIYV